MAQRYSPGIAQQHMDAGGCPECGNPPAAHPTGGNWWEPALQVCSLYRGGVEERLSQYRTDQRARTS